MTHATEVARILRERLDEQSMPEPNSGCQLWLGRVVEKSERNGHGYGRMRWQGRDRAAHHLAWVAINGDIPPGLIVRHKCDVPGCINVAHLRLGTQADNMADMRARGRQIKGESHHQARLTAAQVLEIRAAEGTHAELAARFGVVPQTIAKIKSGQRWTHLKTAQVHLLHKPKKEGAA